MNARRFTIVNLLFAMFTAAAPSKSGLPIGSRFPGDLHNLLGPKGAAIFLYPHTDVNCPVCKSLRGEIAQNRYAFQNLGIEVADMSDERTVVSQPGWFILDPKGVIIAKYFAERPDQSYTPAAVLVHQFHWTPSEPGTPVEGKQLTATVGASNTDVAPGERVALILDIDLPPSMHVYAPGVENYIPIEWKIENAVPAEVQAPVLPQPEKLYLKAIDETVPTYRNHFRLIRDITLPSNPESLSSLEKSGELKVAGSLRYQACDDRVCYIPQKLPLAWKFAYHSR